MTEFSFDLFVTPAPINSFINVLSKRTCCTEKFGYLQDTQQGVLG